MFWKVHGLLLLMVYKTFSGNSMFRDIFEAKLVDFFTFWTKIHQKNNKKSIKKASISLKNICLATCSTKPARRTIWNIQGIYLLFLQVSYVKRFFGHIFHKYPPCSHMPIYTFNSIYFIVYLCIHLDFVILLLCHYIAMLLCHYVYMMLYHYLSYSFIL